MFDFMKLVHGIRLDDNEKIRSLIPALNRRILDVWEDQCDTIKGLDNVSLPEAIWGISSHAKLSPLQLQLHNQIKPIVSDILSMLTKNKFNQNQVYFIDHTIKELITIKFAYLRDVTTLKSIEKFLENQLASDSKVLH